MNDTEKMEELKRIMVALDELDKLIKPIQNYRNKISLIPEEEQTTREKLWLLAYNAVNEKMKPGTDASTIEAANLFPILYEEIPE